MLSFALHAALLADSGASISKVAEIAAQADRNSSRAGNSSEEARMKPEEIAKLVEAVGVVLKGK